jgi:phospholipid/cholesterol/gamma-HCH transport system substrate-binding protein
VNENSVSGMLIGAAVLFNGIRVGEVTELKLDPQKPREVTATIAVTAGTPVRMDTAASIDFQGLTGVAVVTLNGGSPASPALPSGPSHPPMIADPLAGQNMTQAARTVLQRLDLILSENSEGLKKTVSNLSTFAEALGRNSDRVDGIIAGLERMTAGGATAAGVVYDLSAPRTFPAPSRSGKTQLTVADPSAVLMLDTQKILVRPQPPNDPAFDNARWSDSVPKLVQARIVQAFENSKYAIVGRPADNLTSDYQLQIDVRSFEVSTAPETSAVVELSARLVGENGRIKDARVFRGTQALKLTDAASAAAALNDAFGKAATELVIWASGAIQ